MQDGNKLFPFPTGERPLWGKDLVFSERTPGLPRNQAPGVPVATAIHSAVVPILTAALHMSGT